MINKSFAPIKVTTLDKEPMKLCGVTSPGVIVTNSNIVTLDYNTDSDGQSGGWSLDYSTQSENNREKFTPDIKY